jgi:hypothetical protein
VHADGGRTHAFAGNLVVITALWCLSGWRKLHNEELHNLYSLPSIIRTVKSRRMRWAGHVARMVEKRNACRILVGKSEGKRPLGRPRHRWVDLREIGCNGMVWTG